MLDQLHNTAKQQIKSINALLDDDPQKVICTGPLQYLTQRGPFMYKIPNKLSGVGRGGS